MAKLICGEPASHQFPPQPVDIEPSGRRVFLFMEQRSCPADPRTASPWGVLGLAATGAHIQYRVAAFVPAAVTTWGVQARPPRHTLRRPTKSMETVRCALPARPAVCWRLGPGGCIVKWWRALAIVAVTVAAMLPARGSASGPGWAVEPTLIFAGASASVLDGCHALRRRRVPRSGTTTTVWARR